MSLLKVLQGLGIPLIPNLKMEVFWQEEASVVQTIAVSTTSYSFYPSSPFPTFCLHAPRSLHPVSLGHQGLFLGIIFTPSVCVTIRWGATMQYSNRAEGNHTAVTYFILLGLTSEPKLQTPLFVIFFMIYLITLTGNLGLMALIKTSPQLHTPMYFFLCNLSVVDLCYSSIFAPKLLLGFLVEKKTISYPACFLQHFFFLMFVTTEVFLLAVMAYDRYVAICNPLLYTVSMPRVVCVQLVAASYMGGILNSLIQTCCLLLLPFCGPNTINHYFCDTNPLLKLSCSNNHLNELLLVILNGSISMSVLFLIITSYVYILFSILRIRSAEGRHKAFSTCASHLLTVALFYVPSGLSHMQSASKYSLEMEKVTAVLYTLIVPMLNPLIYSLRNKDVKDALRKATANNLIESCLLTRPVPIS
ncbi:olfactory receptor 5J3-like [Guaruba guarouba]